MSAAIALIPLILAILQALPGIIQAIEALHDQSGGGPVKKGLALNFVRKAITVATAADPKLAKFLTPAVQQQVEAVAGEAIDSTVAVMNTTAPAPKPAA